VHLILLVIALLAHGHPYHAAAPAPPPAAMDGVAGGGPS